MSRDTVQSVAHSSPAPLQPADVVDDVATRYDAFISYSHAGDHAVASAFQDALETVGRSLPQWLWRLPAIRVYRDQTDLDADPSVWPALQDALERADNLVLLASPRSRRSSWVTREVEEWLRKDPKGRRLHVVLVDGDIVARADHTLDPALTTALAPEVCARIGEPLYADLRETREPRTWSLRDARFLEASLMIAAPIRGVTKRKLRRIHHRTVAKVVFALTAITAVIAWWGPSSVMRGLLNRAMQTASAAMDLQHVDPSAAVVLMEEALAQAWWPEMLGFGRLPTARRDLRELLRAAAAERRILKHDGVTHVRLDAAERRVATAGGGDVRVTELESGRLVGSPIGLDGVVTGFAVAPGGDRVLTVVGHDAVRLWSFDGTDWRGEVVSAGRAVREIAFDREGQLVTAGYEGARTWRRDATGWAEASAVLGEDSGWKSDVTHVALAGAGPGAIATTPDALWTWNRGKSLPMRSWENDTDDAIAAAGISMNGEIAFAATKQKLVWWSRGVHAEPETVWLDGKLEAVAMNPTGDLIAAALTSGGQHQVVVRAAGARQSSIVLRVPRPIRDLTIGCESSCVLVARDDGIVSVRRFDGANDTTQPFNPATTVALSRDGTLVATGDGNGTVYVWDRVRGREVASFPRGEDTLDYPFHVEVEEGGRVAAAFANGQVRVRSLSAGGDTRSLDGWSVLRIAAFDTAAGRVLTASDQRVVLWDTRTEPPRERRLPVDGVVAARMPPGSPRFFTATRDAVQTWDGIRDTPIEARPHPGRAASVVFDCQGARVAIATASAVYVSSVQGTGRVVGPLAHDGTVERIALSCDGSVVAAIARGTHVRTWNAASGVLIGDWRASFPLADLALSEEASVDRGYLATLGRGGSVAVWGLAEQAIVAEPLSDTAAPAGPPRAVDEHEVAPRLLDFAAGDSLLVARTAAGVRVIRREGFLPLLKLQAEFRDSKGAS